MNTKIRTYSEYLNEGRKSVTVKRKYTDQHPSITAGKYAPVREKILNFIKSKEDEGGAKISDLKEFINNMNEDIGSKTSTAWIYNNTKYLKNVKLKEDNEKRFKLSKLGNRVLNKTVLNEQFINESKNSNVTYEAIVKFTKHEDDYEEGKSIKPIESFNEKFENTNLDYLFEEIFDEFDIDKKKKSKTLDVEIDDINDYGWGTEIWMARMVNKEGEDVEVDTPEWEQFKRGEIKLYIESWHIIVSEIRKQPVSHRELKGVKVLNV